MWKASYQDEQGDVEPDGPARRTSPATSRRSRRLALAAVALVWLIACTNASNLLDRARHQPPARARRSAPRSGASRERVVRYLLAESALLAVGAAASGIALAWVGIRPAARSRRWPTSRAPQEIALDGARAVAAGRARRSRARCCSASFRPIHGTRRSGGRVAAVVRPIVDRHVAASGGSAAFWSPASSPITTPLLDRRGTAARQPQPARSASTSASTPATCLSGSMVAARRRSIAEPGARRGFWDELAAARRSAARCLARRVRRRPSAERRRRLQQLRSRGRRRRRPDSRSRSRRGSGHAGVLPAARSVAARRTPASTSATARAADRSRRRRSRVGAGGSSRTRAPSASGSTRAAARRVRGRRSSASSASVKYAGLDKPDEGTVYTPIPAADPPDPDARPISSSCGPPPIPASVLPGAAADRPRSRPDPAVLERRDDRRRSSAQSLEPPRSLSMLVARLRGRGAAAVDRRHLRRDGVLRPAAHARTSASAWRSAAVPRTCCGWSSARA